MVNSKCKSCLIDAITYCARVNFFQAFSKLSCNRGVRTTRVVNAGGALQKSWLLLRWNNTFTKGIIWCGAYASRWLISVTQEVPSGPMFLKTFNGFTTTGLAATGPSWLSAKLSRLQVFEQVTECVLRFISHTLTNWQRAVAEPGNCLCITQIASSFITFKVFDFCLKE